MADLTATCSVRSRSVGEPLLGTATHAAAWVALEQPGPWGRKALTQSHLDPDLGAELEKKASDAGAKVALIRRPGWHADSHDRHTRRIWVASTRPGRTWLLGGRITDPARLRDLDWRAVADCDADAVRASIPGLSPEREPLLLVCTNGRRDMCCALHGRRLIDEVHDDLGDRLVESIHLGGHRFAPTSLVLPYGTSYGRLTPELTLQIMDAAGRGVFVPTGYRGRTTYPKAVQAAEGAVRVRSNATGLDELDIRSAQSEGDTWHVTVAHVDGRRWDVAVERVDYDASRPESCGASAEPVTAHEATILSEHTR